MSDRYSRFAHPLVMPEWVVNCIFQLLEDRIFLWHLCLLLWLWNKFRTTTVSKESRKMCSWCLFIQWVCWNRLSTESLDSLKTRFSSRTCHWYWVHEMSKRKPNHFIVFPDVSRLFPINFVISKRNILIYSQLSKNRNCFWFFPCRMRPFPDKTGACEFSSIMSIVSNSGLGSC